MFVRIPDPLFVPTDEVVKKCLQTVFPRMKSFKSDTIANYIITDVYTKMRRGMWAQRPITDVGAADGNVVLLKCNCQGASKR